MEQLEMENLFSAVQHEDTAALLGLFENGEAHLSLPSFGTISNNRVFAMLIHKIANRFRYLKVSARHLHTEYEEKFLVSEYMLSYLFYDEERKKNISYDTPTALFCERGSTQKITGMTVYTGFDAFVGREVIRPAIYNASDLIWDMLPASVREAYEKDTMNRYEYCRMSCAGNRIYVEDSALFVKGEICTPQAHLSVFELGEEGLLKARHNYGAVVWDFKLWPTLY